VAHEVDAGDTLDDAVVRDAGLAKLTWAEAKSLGCALVVGDLVAKVLEVIVSHQLVLGFGRRAWRGGCRLFVRIIVEWGGLSNSTVIAVFALDVRNIGEAHSFPLLCVSVEKIQNDVLPEMGRLPVLFAGLSGRAEPRPHLHPHPVLRRAERVSARTRPQGH
jgi:hypothetical protein